MSYTLCRKSRSAAILLFASPFWLSFPLLVCAQADSAQPAGTHFDRVVIVVLENAGLSQALADPYIASLTEKAAWLSNYRALGHPSLPNYLAIVAGSTFGLETDHPPASLKGPTIVDRLETKGLSWKSYAENYPGGCYLGSGAGAGRLTPTAAPTELYARKHVPLLAFASIQKSKTRCAHIVGGNQFMRDARAGKLPNYAFYTPNMFNDGHDTSLEASSTWLKGFLRALAGTVAMHQRTLVVITWDEAGGRDLRGNRVLAILLGDQVAPGRYTASLSHYSLLRTIVDNFGLESVAAGDRSAPPLPEKVWR